MTKKNDFLKFLKNFAAVIALVALTITALFIATPPDDKHLYQASLLKSNLLRTVPSPRIIIVGGSNVAFGIDSELMEEELDIPVINDGLHVALGIAPLNEIKANLRAILSSSASNITTSPIFRLFTVNLNFWQIGWNSPPNGFGIYTSLTSRCRPSSQ